jgi:hypothetical protein
VGSRCGWRALDGEKEASFGAGLGRWRAHTAVDFKTTRQEWLAGDGVQVAHVAGATTVNGPRRAAAERLRHGPATSRGRDNVSARGTAASGSHGQDANAATVGFLVCAQRWARRCHAGLARRCGNLSGRAGPISGRSME